NLVSGELVARGRRGSPHAESGLIPGSAWKTLNFDDLKRSIVCEPAPSKTKIYDLRFVSALYADDILEHLHGEPLVQAFKRFVFDDPQVASLRRRAIARGGKPRNVGHPHLLYQAYWYVDHGTVPKDDSIGFLSERREGPHAQAANEALRDRFGRLVQLLRDGKLVADGALSGQGAMAEIS